MDLEFVWRLPSTYARPLLASRLSSDAQVYVRCRHCAREARVDPMFVSDSADQSGNACADTPCGACGRRGLEFVRHLEHRQYECRDCGHGFSAQTARFLSDRCPRCSSSRLARTWCGDHHTPASCQPAKSLAAAASELSGPLPRFFPGAL
jgi:Zn finger protein HypA/HybF involved in hydrogenase expression